MDFSLVADSVSVAAANQSVGFGKLLLRRGDLASGHHVSFADSSGDPSPGGGFQVSAVIFPVDVIASKLVRSSAYKTIRRTLHRKKRRTRRISFSGDSEDGGDLARFLLDGDNGGFNGPYGFGGGGGNDGGRGWNFGGFGRGDWDESSSLPSWSDPAMEFVYEVLCWIALSNCVHFAFKRIVRILTDGEREKLTMRLTPVC
ncbi:PREDICTED: protein gar2-like [Tarenaya hassleriana]|uniref:protein gar2-like n=1 Tax=Tarenaya hassleriana TaxID=28532 RepID=UPI00053C6D3C|nr:PREDICTED: protein gar2-like [Tarenaya hassleriana]